MKLSFGPFNEKEAFSQLTSYYKQGYCSIPAMATLIRNDYRELSLKDAVKIINKWIDECKIKEEHVGILYNKRLKKFVVMSQSFVDKVKERGAAK